MSTFTDWNRLEVIAPNFKRRLSGVTSTIIQLVPLQAKQGVGIATLGPGLPDHLPKLRYRDVWRLWRRLPDGKSRIWHARRNVEMIAGVVLRDVLLMPMKLVFTSAAQRHHKPFTKWLIGRMDHVIATSAKSGSYLDCAHTVINHGVDTSRFTPPTNKHETKATLGLDPERSIIGCSGRIRPSKGTDLFVDAMIALLPHHDAWDAVITGRATSEFAGFKRDLEQRISAAGLAQRIRFVGEVDDIVPWYQAFDLFVAPSRQEGFGLTPLEAMACGVHCVTSDAGSYAEIIGLTGNGRCVPADDARALHDAISAMLDLQLIPKTALEAEHYSLSSEARRISSVYMKLWEESA